MLRKDRLFNLIQILRDGRLHRAQDIADRLQISLRTVYRDMDTLIASGVPIEGARGLGYMATAAITLPPLNLSQAELAALQQGLALVAGAADKALQTAAKSLLAKLDAVLPDTQQIPGLADYDVLFDPERERVQKRVDDADVFLVAIKVFLTDRNILV